QIFDNQYILSMVETGLIGTVAFAALFLVAGYAALRSRFLSADPVTRDLGLTIAACLVLPLVGSFTFDLLSFHTVTGISFLLVGAAGALLRAEGGDQLARTQASGLTREVTRAFSSMVTSSFPAQAVRPHSESTGPYAHDWSTSLLPRTTCLPRALRTC